MSNWLDHPTVRSGQELKFRERAADWLRLGMGSWTFFMTFGVILAIWMTTGLFTADPRPYFLLNLCLSMLAGLQGSALLISDKRADRIRSEVARHHLEISEEVRKMVEEIHHIHVHIDPEQA